MQALQCTGPCISAIRDASLHRYMEFMPVSTAYIYDRDEHSLRPVPASAAAVHTSEGLSVDHKRRLWLLLREVERAATGGATSLFGRDDFAAALAQCGLPTFVQVRLLIPMQVALDVVCI